METKWDEGQLNELLYCDDIDIERYLIEGGNRMKFKKWCKSHGLVPPKALLNNLPNFSIAIHIELVKNKRNRKRFNHKRN